MGEKTECNENKVLAKFRYIECGYEMTSTGMQWFSRRQKPSDPELDAWLREARIQRSGRYKRNAG